MALYYGEKGNVPASRIFGGRADWLHLIGLGLGGPQAAENLVAASVGANYQMKVFEDLLAPGLRQFAEARGTAGFEVEAWAEVKPGTDLATRIFWRAWRNNELIADLSIDANANHPTIDEINFWHKE
jgi:hypothetical protein